jgi:hypothetical protein
MAVIESAKIEAALSKKGFRKHDDDHHRWWIYYQNRKTHVFTKISHGSGYKDYSDDLFKKVYSQLNLNKKQLISLVECEIDEEAYIEIMKQEGILP